MQVQERGILPALQQLFWDRDQVITVSIYLEARAINVLLLMYSNFFPSLHLVGIEIHEDVVQHCKESIASWKEAYPPARSIHHIDIIRGNALEVDTEKGECALGFDRIYIGAAIEKHQLPRFKKLLKPGGILVGPGTYSIS
jgi:hypothetical protein